MRNKFFAFFVALSLVISLSSSRVSKSHKYGYRNSWKSDNYIESNTEKKLWTICTNRYKMKHKRWRETTIATKNWNSDDYIAGSRKKAIAVAILDSVTKIIVH